MPSSGPNSAENLSSSSPAAPSFATRMDNDREVKDVSEDIGVAANVETGDVEDIEDGINLMGRVSETLNKKVGENQKSSKGGGKQDDVSGTTPAQIRAQLLKNMPKEPVMRKQIEKEIKKEIKYLHKKASKLIRTTGDVNYFEMSNVLRKIRELKGILLFLVKASLESMKTLWLRFVHGIM